MHHLSSRPSYEFKRCSSLCVPVCPCVSLCVSLSFSRYEEEKMPQDEQVDCSLFHSIDCVSLWKGITFGQEREGERERDEERKVNHEDKDTHMAERFFGKQLATG